MIPPTRYIDAGTPMPMANPQVAMAHGEAMARMGQTLQHIGERGFQIAEKVRKIDEAGKISALFANFDEEAAEFSNQLMTRSDTEAWPAEWKQRSAAMRERMKEVGISPEGMANADREFTQWASNRSIGFETQAATKALHMGRAQVGNALKYYASRNDSEGYKREADRGLASGTMDPVEYEQALREGDEIFTRNALDEDIQNDPDEVLERMKDPQKFLADNPGTTTAMMDYLARNAKDRKEELRAAELERIDQAATEGKLKPADIEAARYLTARDRRVIAETMKKTEPPTNEEHAKAWIILDNLREARNDPKCTPEEYRRLWNESRVEVMNGIAPQWQGDLKRELNYLTPAGRNPDGGGFDGETQEDLIAYGREQATRALQAGVFGPVGKERPYKETEPAYRKYESIRQEIKQFVKKNSTVGRNEVREFTDRLIAGDRAETAAGRIKMPAPGLGGTMRSMPDMEPGTGRTEGGLLPPMTPDEELEDFTK